MAIQWTSAIRDQVCITLMGKVYADLTTYEQKLIDGESTGLPVATPTGGVAKDGFTRIREWAQWFAEAGTSAGQEPAAWEYALKCDIVALAAKAFRSEFYGTLANDAQRALQQAIDTYSPTDFSDSSQLFGTSTLSIQRIRLFVIRNCVRRRPRVMPRVDEVDLAFKWALNHLSERGAWGFRTRNVEIAISTTSGGSAPTITGQVSGETFDCLLSQDLFFKDSTGELTGQCIKYANPEVWQQSRVEWGDETGQPEFFRIETRGAGSYYWQFSPRPDKAYTVNALVLVSTPSLPSAATDTATIAKYPKEFDTIFPDLVLAKVLRDASATGWSDVWDRVQAEIDKWVQYQQRTTASQGEPCQRDVYNDAGFQTISRI